MREKTSRVREGREEDGKVGANERGTKEKRWNGEEGVEGRGGTVWARE